MRPSRRGAYGAIGVPFSNLYSWVETRWNMCRRGAGCGLDLRDECFGFAHRQRRRGCDCGRRSAGENRRRRGGGHRRRSCRRGGLTAGGEEHGEQAEGQQGARCGLHVLFLL